MLSNAKSDITLHDQSQAALVVGHTAKEVLDQYPNIVGTRSIRELEHLLIYIQSQSHTQKTRIRFHDQDGGSP